MAKFAHGTIGKVDRERFSQTGKSTVNEEVGDMASKVKYMERYLAKDKKYIPYEKQKEYQEMQDRKIAKQRESVEDRQPLLVVLCIVGVIIIAVLWGTGVFG